MAPVASKVLVPDLKDNDINNNTKSNNKNNNPKLVKKENKYNLHLNLHLRSTCNRRAKLILICNLRQNYFLLNNFCGAIFP